MFLADENPETLFSLRQKFAKFCKPGSDTQPALKTICMVGAYNSVNGMPWNELDKLYLNITLMRLQQAGIAVDPDFEIEIENKDPHEGGKDFLKRNQPADIVLLCCIFNPPTINAIPFQNAAGSGRFTISEDHYKPFAWRDAALRVGAKVISVIGDDGSSEVGPSVFRPANDNNKQFIELPNAKTRRGLNIHLLRHKDFNPMG